MRGRWVRQATVADNQKRLTRGYSKLEVASQLKKILPKHKTFHFMRGSL